MDPEAFLPLTPVVFEVLLSLADGERHGYGIMVDVEERTDGRTVLHPGSLYRVLSRLRRDGLIEELDERAEPDHDDERRRYYRLTRLGRQVARGEARRLAGQLSTARAKNLLRPSRRRS